jgi:hypothetical protein
VKWTRHKLGEATFFLQQVKSVLDQPEILSYYLSAFISAARSVTMVLQFENGENQEFIDWYSKRQKDMKKDDILGITSSPQSIDLRVCRYFSPYALRVLNFALEVV